jgi:hypothetical protein
MIIDYSERRQVRRNQVKRPSAWPYVLLIMLFVGISYLFGVGTGWYLFRPGGRLFKLQPAPQQATLPKAAPLQQPQPGSPPTAQQAPQQPGSPATVSPVQPLAPQATEKGAPVPLTFYNTLQKGNKVLMGTGINPPKEQQGGAAKPVTPPAAER